ncbi:Tubulin-specific chaperone A [Aphelenchoides besseyi]|nr:Tubulin-specific chaperone A [Aphelenchoides besseyi]
METCHCAQGAVKSCRSNHRQSIANCEPLSQFESIFLRFLTQKRCCGYSWSGSPLTSTLVMADPKLIRELTIKTNVVKRLVKESESYVKEAEKEREKIKKMEQEDPDNYNIKKAREQHQETLQMVPLVAQKLQIAREALREFIEKNADAVAGTSELSLAEEHLTASEQVKA